MKQDAAILKSINPVNPNSDNKKQQDIKLLQLRTKGKKTKQDTAILKSINTVNPDLDNKNQQDIKLLQLRTTGKKTQQDAAILKSINPVNPDSDNLKINRISNRKRKFLQLRAFMISLFQIRVSTR